MESRFTSTPSRMAYVVALAVEAWIAATTVTQLSTKQQALPRLRVTAGEDLRRGDAQGEGRK